MHADTVHQRVLKKIYCVLFPKVDCRPFRERRECAPFFDTAVSQCQRLAGKHALDPAKYAVRTGGELQLEQFHRGLAANVAWYQTASQDRLRLGGKHNAIGKFRVIERLDAKGIASEIK